ncbi:hypothetical protein F2P81_007142 [Scophthalmus maximus]|uniref:Uncharacterized protein n=1 Tax=Scophthalmus maximus TaxID=52904 RepID=A0A6A4TDI7_SCOMX|nr:hypothetical protein F2P81_007142 [Scophthalmus maximus]
MATLESVLKDCELKYCLPQICKVRYFIQKQCTVKLQIPQALLSAACLACPNDPILFLQNTILAFQGNDNLQDVDSFQFHHIHTLTDFTVALQVHKE